jgi:hypothetical protein
MSRIDSVCSGGMVLFCVFPFYSFSVIAQFESVVFPTGYIYEQFFDTRGALFDVDLHISGGTDSAELSLLVFPESNRTMLFPSSTNFRPVCCPNTSSLCSNSPFLTVYPIRSYNRTLEARSHDIFSVVLANCGLGSIQVSGSINIRPEHGFADDRLILPVQILLAGAWAVVLYIAWWAYRVLHSHPKLAINHQTYVISTCLFVLGTILELTFLWVWNTNQRKIHLLLVLSGLVASLSRTLMYYLTIVGFQTPGDVPTLPFYFLALFFSVTMTIESLGISNFSARRSGDWVLGFGSPSYAQFMGFSLFCAALIVYSVNHPPAEAGNLKMRQLFLFGFGGSFALFFIVSLSVANIRLGKNLLQVRSFEWVPFVIEPAFFVLVTLLNGWFWMGFNPQGWEALGSGSDRGVGADPIENVESLVGSGHQIAPTRGRRKQEFVIDGEDPEPA